MLLRARQMGEVWRYTEIEFEGFTAAGQKIQRHAQGLLARIIQHEVGHLNGELYIDLITSDCRFGSKAEMLPIRRAKFEALNNPL